MGSDHFLKYKNLFEAANPITGNEFSLMMGDEPDSVRIVDLSEQFSDGRYGTVMCVGFIKDQNRWACNHGERVALKLLLERIAELEAQLAKEREDNAKMRDKLACSTCLFRHIPNEPCPYASECCYSTGVGHAEGKNFWASNTDYEELREAAEGK